ncbi:carbohydrate sulfotransferase 3-like [Montipora capricornis]|uniref:carbohydrate sulfotransferase 3-like n=1 Tax=Montipora capricornis TaxID=246305 RepID=UPI0035F18B9A
MLHLRFVFRSFVAAILIMVAFCTFMILRGKNLTQYRDVHEQESLIGEQPSRECSCPICFAHRFHNISSTSKGNTVKSFSPTGWSQPQALDSQSHPDPQPRTKREKRRSLVIFGDDRSGTTFLTRMFSEDSNIFSVYEPLWITRNWFQTEEGRDPVKDVNDVLSALMSCQFVDNRAAVKFLQSTSKKWAAGLSQNPFQSSPICNQSDSGKMSCPDLASLPKIVQNVCLSHFKHSVAKVAIVRVQGRKLSNILPHIIHNTSGTEVKLLHVVRDPRGSINSRINLQWIHDYQESGFFYLPRDTCEGILQNVKYGASLEGSLKKHYKLVRYKDIALSPVKTAMEIYKFAGFEMPESVLHWIVQSTQPTKEVLKKEAGKEFSTIRNATANVEKWRREAPIERTRIIEKECSELFDFLGLDRLTT